MFQAFWTDAVRQMNGVTYRFVADHPVGSTGAVRIVALRRPRRLLAALATSGPNVVHVHGLAFPVQTWHLGRELRGIPIVAQDHGSHLPRGWRRLVHRWGFSRLSGVVFTAREQAAPFIVARIFRPEVPVFEVLESSTRFVPGDQAKARVATGLTGDPCLLWLGNLDENKDPLMVLDALAAVRAALPNVELWCFYRSGSLLQTVQRRLATDPQIASCVHLMGARPHVEVEGLLRSADFLVQASHREGSGYAVVEALACGTTPIVTDIPSFRRITGNGYAGALFPPGDATALARAMIEWSRRDRRALRANARIHFERVLSFEVIGAQLRAVYDRLVGR